MNERPASGSGRGPVGWLRGYPREWLRPDVVAGLTASAVVVPKAMAYATIAGLPVQVGLYTAFVPMVIYALLGTSRPLSVSTTTTIAILTGSTLVAAAPEGSAAQLIAAAATLAVMVGLVLMIASVLRLGFVADFISEPVLVGFKSGICMVIIVDQLPKLLGIHVDKTGFFRDVAHIVQSLPQLSMATVVVSLAVFALILGLERFVPRVPAPLVAMGAAIAGSALLGLPEAGVATVGTVPPGLPEFMLPQLGLVPQMLPAAVAIALMSFTETIASARAFADPGEPRLVPNRELFATGVANVGSGLFGGMPAGGGASQTAVNRRAGAKSQTAALVTAGVAVATLLVLAPLFALMPKAALAALVIAYSFDLFKPQEFREIRRVRTTEFRWAVVAFAGVLLLGTLQGILVAIIVSLLALVMQAYNPPVYALGRKPGTTVFRPVSGEHPDDERWPGLLVVRVEGRVFFANAQRVGDQIWPLVAQEPPRVLLLDCRAITDLEYTALKMLGEAQKKLALSGTRLWLAGMNPSVSEVVRRSRLGEAVGSQRMYLNLQAAVDQYQQEYSQ